jgi:hypothetical protein
MATSCFTFVDGVLGIGYFVKDKFCPRLLSLGVVLHEDTLEDSAVSEELLDLEFPGMLVSSDELWVQVGCLLRDGTELEGLGTSFAFKFSFAFAFALGLELLDGDRLSLDDNRLLCGIDK